MQDDQEQINKQKNLLKRFLFVLWCNESLTTEDYEILIFGKYKNRLGETFTIEINYLSLYRKKHGVYPPKFQQKMNEWILTERM